jgi:hypothetical protein
MVRKACGTARDVVTALAWPLECGNEGGQPLAQCSGSSHPKHVDIKTRAAYRKY